MMISYFTLKLFLFLRFLNFCPDFIDYIEERLQKKAKLDMKVYDIVNWEANNYNTHIAHYLKK